MRHPGPLRRSRPGFTLTDRATLAIGALAAASTVAALAVEIGRVRRRGAAPSPTEAVAETVHTVVEGYRRGSSRENATFNLLVSFVGGLVGSRGVAYLLRSRSAVGPFRSLRVGRRHIHHFVPGIALAFAAGSVAILSRDDRLEPWLAVPFGVGMGLTLDESALLLDLEDVYWTEEGIVGAQIGLSVMAILAALAVGLRFTRRGERIVLPATPPTVAPLPTPV